MKIKTKRGARRVRNQRVRDKRFVVTDYTGCSYITAGKLYRLIDGWLIMINAVEQIRIRRVGNPCAHLHFIGTW